MEQFLKALPTVATSPLALIAYLCTLLAWVLISIRTRRIRTLLDHIEKFPEKDRRSVLEAEMDVKLPSAISPAMWLRTRRQGFFFVGALSILVTLIIVTAMAFWASKSLPAGRLATTIKDEAVLARIYNSPLDFLTVWAKFNSVKPEEVALLLLPSKAPPIRLDFSASRITTSMEGYRGLDNPLTPLSAKISAESGFYIYSVDLTYLRRVDQNHPLSNLALKNIDNIPVQLLLNNQAIERLPPPQAV